MAKDEYMKFKANMKADKVNELVSAIKKNPNDRDLLSGQGVLQQKNVGQSLKAHVKKALAPHLEKDTKNAPQQRNELRI